MREMEFTGNLFLLPGKDGAAVVTTNGIIKKNGEAVMGAGIAKYARDSFPGIAGALGRLITENGNHAYYLGAWYDQSRVQNRCQDPAVSVLNMPTKHDWRDPSDIDLIRQSARELMAIADGKNFQEIYLPAPGCSNGRLDYASQVRPVISQVLDGRFIICLQPDVYRQVCFAGKGPAS